MILKVVALYTVFLVKDAVLAQHNPEVLNETGDSKNHPVLQNKNTISTPSPHNQGEIQFKFADEDNQREELIFSHGALSESPPEDVKTLGKNNKLQGKNGQRSLQEDKMIYKGQNIPIHQLVPSEAKQLHILRFPYTHSTITKASSDISAYLSKDTKFQLDENSSQENKISDIKDMSPSNSIREERGIYGEGYGDLYDKYGNYDDYGSYTGHGDYGGYDHYGSKGNSGYGYGAEHGNKHGYSKGYSKGYEHKYSHEYGHDHGQKFNTAHGHGQNHYGHGNHEHKLYGQHGHDQRDFGYRGFRLGHGGLGFGSYGLTGLGGRLHGRLALLGGGLRSFGNGMIGYSPIGYLRGPLELHYGGNGYGGYGHSGYYPWYNLY